MSETLPLTRRALCAWKRWREAAERERPQVARWAGLGPTEVAGLERLTANWSTLPPGGISVSYSKRGLQPDTRRLEDLLQGLAVTDEVAPLLPRALEAPAVYHGIIAAAITRHTPGREEPMDEATAPPEESEELEETPPASGNGKQPPGPTAKERLAALITARGVDLTRPVPHEQQRQWAEALDTTRSTITGYLSALRTAAGIQAPRTKATHSAPPVPGGNGGAPARVLARGTRVPYSARCPTAAVIRNLVDYGLDALVGEPLREPLRDLLHALLEQPR